MNPTFPNGGPQSQMVATVRSSVNNNIGAVVVSSTLQGDANRLLLLDSGEDTGTELNIGIIIITTTTTTIIIIIIVVVVVVVCCSWVVTQWQWLFYMYTKYEIGY